MRAVIYFIICRFKSRKWQNILSFGVIALCVSVLIVALSLSNGFKNALTDKIFIASPHNTVFGDFEKVLIPNKNDIAYQLKLAQVQALVINQNNHQVQGVLVRGAEQQKIPKLFREKNILLGGKYPKSGQALIGYKLANNLDLRLGDKIQILTGPSIANELTVSGIFRIGLYDFDSNVIITTFNDVIMLQALPEEGIASKVNIFEALWIKDPFKARDFSLSLLKLNPEITVNNWQDDNKSLMDAIYIEKKVIFIVLFLLIVAVSVAIGNSQFIQVLSQAQQIAVLSAIGLTRKNILMIFVLESLITGILGTILGLILAFMVIICFKNHPVALPMDVYQVAFIPVELKSTDAVITAFATILIVCLSSIIPAFYAARLDPVEILRRT